MAEKVHNNNSDLKHQVNDVEEQPAADAVVMESCQYFGEFLNRMKSKQPATSEEAESLERLKDQMRAFLSEKVSVGPNDLEIKDAKDDQRPAALNNKVSARDIKPDEPKSTQQQVASGAISKVRNRYTGGSNKYLGSVINPFGNGLNKGEYGGDKVINQFDQASNLRDFGNARSETQASKANRNWRKAANFNEDSDESETDSEVELTSSDEDSRSRKRRSRPHKNVRNADSRDQPSDSWGNRPYWMGEMRPYPDLRQPPRLEKFSDENGQDFERFLNRFELYCEQNVRGGTEFWLGILEDHLEGKILENFKIVRRHYDDYAAVVSQLVDWHNESAELRKRKLMKRFKTMTPDSGESLYRFSMRLCNAFMAAKPKHKNPNKSRTLMKRFLKALPSRSRRALKSKVASHRLRGNKPDWEFYQRCVKVADLYEESSDSSDTGESGPETVEVNLGQHEEKREYHQSFRARRGSYGGSSQRGNCYTCGQSGHYAAQCWWNLGLCAACGKDDHFISACPRKVSGNRGAGSSQPQESRRSGPRRSESGSVSPRGRGSRGGFRGRSFRGRGGFSYGGRGFGRGAHNPRNSSNIEYYGDQRFATGANSTEVGQGMESQPRRDGSTNRLRPNAAEFQPGAARLSGDANDGSHLNY